MEGVKGGFAWTLTRHFTCGRCPGATAALAAVPQAYHNPAAFWWGVFAPSVVIRDQVVAVGSGAAVAAGDGVHGEPLPQSAQDYRGVATGDWSPVGRGSGPVRPQGARRRLDAWI